VDLKKNFFLAITNPGRQHRFGLSRSWGSVRNRTCAKRLLLRIYIYSRLEDGLQLSDIRHGFWCCGVVPSRTYRHAEDSGSTLKGLNRARCADSGANFSAKHTFRRRILTEWWALFHLARVLVFSSPLQPTKVITSCNISFELRLVLSCPRAL
jgi:hypothetical protein